MFYTGRRIPGDEAVRIGLADVLVPQAEVRSAAQALALEIAQSAPLAVLATRETVRRGLFDAIEAATERELVEQDWLRRTEDFQEGIKADGRAPPARFPGPLIDISEPVAQRSRGKAASSAAGRGGGEFGRERVEPGPFQPQRETGRRSTAGNRPASAPPRDLAPAHAAAPPRDAPPPSRRSRRSARAAPAYRARRA